VDEIAAGANGLVGLLTPNLNGRLLGTAVVVEAGGKFKPPLPNSGGADVVAVGTNVKLLGLVKALVVEDAGNEIVVVVTAGAGVIVEVAVLVGKDIADVLGVNVNAGD